MKKVAIAILVLAILIGGYTFFVGTVNDNSNVAHNRSVEQYDDEYFYEDEYGDENENGSEEGYVIETEVDGPEDCTSLEEYDAENSICFIECETPEECDAIEIKLDDALDELEGDYQDFVKDFKEFEGEASEAEKKAEVTYRIDKGENFVIESGVENASHIKIKKWLADISPNKFSDIYLSRLILLSNTDDDSAAFVTPSDSGAPDSWDMFVNMTSMKEDGDKEMVFTLIHEFAHILTFNNSQVKESVNKTSCKNYFIDEGCMNTNAYLNIFYDKFWKGKFNPIVEDSMENYDKEPSAFVTEYAATNPGEDIAETFATFVFKKKIEDNTIAGQKVTFFYTYPELRKMRGAIRSMLKPFVRKRIVQ